MLFYRGNMPQWPGACTGNTHWTRVRDAEAALRHAIIAHRHAEGEEAAMMKAKAVFRFAVRLLAARLRAVRALLAKKSPRGGSKAPSHELESLRHREATMRAEGIAVILAEFDVPDVLSLLSGAS